MTEMIVMIVAAMIVMIDEEVTVIADFVMTTTLVLEATAVMVVLHMVGEVGTDLVQEKGLLTQLFSSLSRSHLFLRAPYDGGDGGWGGERRNYDSRDNRGPPPSDNWGGPPRRSRRKRGRR
jgi:hypothetical protein